MVKRRCLRTIQDIELNREHFHLPRLHVRVDCALGAPSNHALDRQNIFAANSFGVGKYIGPVRIEHDLQQALPIAQIDEDHATVIAPPVHPATGRDLLADQRFINMSAIMAAHHEIRETRLKKEAEW